MPTVPEDTVVDGQGVRAVKGVDQIVLLAVPACMVYAGGANKSEIVEEFVLVFAAPMQR